MLSRPSRLQTSAAIWLIYMPRFQVATNNATA